ncbi:MAG: dihydrolipoamide acetyltransferase family protein [Planctomycetia bacterium]|nr:dihydrolipoamide acetyltransferase family protein [Planctomycetia bacterium]
MANKVIMPKQGLQMTEGTITKWLIPEGESVKKDQPLFEMETDKLTITIDSPFDGVLLKIVRKEWETVPITEMIAIIGQPGEDISSLLTESPAVSGISAGSNQAGSNPAGSKLAAFQESFPSKMSGNENSGICLPKNSQDSSFVTKSGRILISPRAKRIAEEKGIEYSQISGSGKDGMIVEKDLNAYLSVKATPLARKMAGSSLFSGISGSGSNGRIRCADLTSTSQQEEIEPDTIIPIAGMRRVISENMTSSLHNMAQANHKIRVDMSESVKIRAAFKSRDESVSFNDIVIATVARALIEMPWMNAVADDKMIYRKHYVNMGVAVAIENGLIVPTIRNADRKSLPQIHEEMASLAKKAKKGELSKEEYSDGTFTITNLGMFGLDEFVAIINPPQVGILAVGAITETPVVEKGSVVIRPIMSLTLTYDHRIVDGAPAAKFLHRVKELLENPYLYLL